MTKKGLIVIMFFFLHLSVCAQTVIQMEKESGVYKIACKVNGARMKMVFDTGAATVSLSMSMANYLYENDYINKGDIIGSGKSQTADGSIVDHIVINLRDIEISGMHIRNVKATVIDGQNAPLLLGQTAIQKLGSVTISGNRLIINKSSARALSEEEIKQLRVKAYDFYKEGSYFGAIDWFEKLRNSSCLYSNDYFCYIYSCNKVGQYKKAIELISEWENGDLFTETEAWGKALIYGQAVFVYDKQNDYDSAINYIQKEIASNQESGIEINPLDYRVYANIYFSANEKDMAQAFIIKAINTYLSKGGYMVADIYNGRIYDNDYRENIAECLLNYGYFINGFDNIYISDSVKILWAGAAMCGNERAISLCNTFDIYYRSGYKSSYAYLFRDRF